MPEALAPLFDFNGPALLLIAVRLLLALALGLAIAAIYRRARPMNEEAESFTVTLVLLTILIAMVTQVIGDNVARAFSLVGALSIVRFRTVVRDTQDTAFVIFSVATAWVWPVVWASANTGSASRPKPSRIVVLITLPQLPGALVGKDRRLRHLPSVETR